MIRDPSDGSVRDPFEYEAPPPKSSRTVEITVTNKGRAVAPVIETTTSGLQTGSNKPENIARLENSREWLKQYRQKIADINRMNDKGEIPKEEQS